MVGRTRVGCRSQSSGRVLVGTEVSAVVSSEHVYQDYQDENFTNLRV